MTPVALRPRRSTARSLARLPGRDRGPRRRGRGRRCRRVRPGEAAGDRAGPQRIRVGGAVGSLNACPSNSPEPSETASGRAAPWVALLGPGGIGPSLERPRVGDSSGREWRTDDRKRFLPVAWSPDGTRLLMNDGHILVAEVGDQIGPFTEAGIDVPDGQQWEAFDFARDDERVVFVQKSKCPKGPSATGSASSRSRPGGVRCRDGRSELLRPEHHRPAHGCADGTGQDARQGPDHRREPGARVAGVVARRHEDRLHPSG